MKLLRFLQLACVVAVTLGASNASAQSITARVTASRTSGAAPLYVFFYAVQTPEGAAGTTCTGSSLCSNVFRNLDFDWDFDDASAGTWTHGTNEVGLSRSRNEANGPLAAHLFTSAGTYDVVLTVRGPLGGVATQTIQVTVTAESAQWPGTETVCVGNTTPTAGSGGCPAGAAIVTTSTLTGLNGSCNQSDRRCLLRAGDTFTGGTFVIGANGPSYLSAFGTANDGRATIICSDNQNCINLSNRCDWRFSNLDFTTASSSTPAQAIFQGGCYPTTGVGNVYINTRNLATRFRNAVNGSCTDLDNSGLDIYGPMGAFNNEWNGFGLKAITGNVSGGNIVFFCGRRLAVMGNLIYDTLQGEHNSRFQHYEGLVMSHNTLGEQASGRGAIQLRSRPQNFDQPNGECSAGCGRPSRDGLVSYNHVTPNLSGGATRTTGAGSGTDDDPQAEDVIFEHNFFDDFAGLNASDGFGSVTDTTRFTLRNNVFFGAGRSVFNVWTYSGNARGQGATDVAIYNNTCYYRADTGTLGSTTITTASPVRCIRAGGNFVANNLLYAPLSTGTKQVWEGQANNGDGVAGNDIPSANPFAVTPDVFAEFALKSGAPQINAGVTTLPVYRDVTGAFRTGAPDVGAFEFGSVVDPPDQCTPVDCSDANQCTQDACTGGTCSNTNLPLNTPCNDGNAGTDNDVCNGSGTCAGITPAMCMPAGCDDSNQCTQNVCPVSGICDNSPLAAGTTCDDGDPDTSNDRCDGAGTCEGVEDQQCFPVDCNDANPCTDDVCTTGNCTNPARSNGTPCDDGNPLTSGDQCLSAICTGSTGADITGKLVAYRTDTDAILYDPYTGGAGQPLDRAIGFALCYVKTGGAASIGSVRWFLNGALTGTENIAPYCQNDEGGNFRQYEEILQTGEAWRDIPLTSVTPYTGSAASGQAGPAITGIVLRVIDSSVMPEAPDAPNLSIRGAKGIPSAKGAEF